MVKGGFDGPAVGIQRGDLLRGLIGHRQLVSLSVEVQRLSRNCSDWYPLLDICGYKHCLIADCDGV
jgi:hypothetical protein